MRDRYARDRSRERYGGGGGGGSGRASAYRRFDEDFGNSPTPERKRPMPPVRGVGRRGVDEG